MKISGIYKIESKLKPERIYVGSALRISERWWHHKSNLKHNRHTNRKLQNHYNKYGEPDLQFSVLLGCEKEDLIKNEQLFIDSYKPYFNISPSAYSCRGLKLSDETKLKISKAGKGRRLSEEHKRKIGESNKIANLNQIQSEETKQKRRYSMIGKNVGRKHSEESKLNMSLGRIGMKLSEEHKKKISEGNYRRWSKRIA